MYKQYSVYSAMASMKKKEAKFEIYKQKGINIGPFDWFFRFGVYSAARVRPVSTEHLYNFTFVSVKNNQFFLSPFNLDIQTAIEIFTSMNGTDCDLNPFTIKHK